MPQGRNLAINLVVRSKQAAKQLNQFETRTQRLGRALKTGLAIGATVAAGALVKFGTDSIKLGSNLEQAKQKIDAVFGAEGAARITEWADTTATNFGISETAATQAAGTFGNLFSAFGVGTRKAEDYSVRLVELAGDLASFNDTSVDDAITALRSGLSGETEPLKRFGVSLNDARLKQEALTLGLYDGTGALDAASKAQAAYQLILKDTALAQGDYARTGDSAANAAKTLQASLEDLQASFGEGVLKGFQGGTEQAKDLGQSFNDLEDDAADLGEALGETAAAGLTLYGVIGDINESGFGKAFSNATEQAIGRFAISISRNANALGLYTDEQLAADEALYQYQTTLRRFNGNLQASGSSAGEYADEVYGAAAANDEFADSARDAAAATFDYRKQRTLNANLDYLDAAARARLRDSWDALEFTVADYNRTSGRGASITRSNDTAQKSLEGTLEGVRQEYELVADAARQAIAERDAFLSDFNAGIGSGVSLAGALSNEEVTKQLEASGAFGADAWINGFQQQLFDAEDAGAALEELRGELVDAAGQPIAGADLLLDQLLAVPPGLIPNVVDNLINAPDGLVVGLAGQLNNIFNGPLGEGWAETFHGAGVDAAADILGGLKDSAKSLENKYEQLGHKIGKDIRKGIKAEIDAVLEDVRALEGRVTGAGGRVQATPFGATGGYRARNTAQPMPDRIATARALAQVQRDAEAALGARP